MNKTLCNVGLILAIALVICVFPMPYGYYTLVRFVSMIIFGCMAYIFYKEERGALCIVAGSLALLFQPFYKIILGKAMWNMVDVMVALALVLLWYKNRKN
jgi:hypothetical protein